MLTIPQKRDPFARGILIALIGAIVYTLISTLTVATPEAVSAQDIILIATPTLGLPMRDNPAFALEAPTPTAAPWIDQALNEATEIAQQFADDQAAQLAAEREQYLANVGAQAAHSPRGDVDHPPTFQTGPIAQPVNADNEIIVIDPNPVVVTAPRYAAAVPAISPDQAAVLSARQSNGCAAGEIFYPRSGCHLPGSGGVMPGAVGQP